MAYLITEDPKFLLDFVSKDETDCNFGYKAFANSRQIIPFDQPKFKTRKTKFVEEVIKPISKISGGKIKMGRYFVFKVSDIRALLEESYDFDYVHVHSLLDEEGYNRLIIVPYKSTDDAGKEKTIQTETLENAMILLDGLPCPPHPNCPLY